MLYNLSMVPDIYRHLTIFQHKFAIFPDFVLEQASFFNVWAR